MATRTGKIEITSLVTRIAMYLGVLAGAQVTYLDTPRETFNEEHFVHAHLLKRVEGELIMLYHHSSTTIVLPCPEHSLYQVKWFTLNLTSEDDEETIRPSRHSISRPGPATRSRTRKSDRNLIAESTTQQAPTSGRAEPSSSYQHQPQSNRSQPPSASKCSSSRHSQSARFGNQPTYNTSYLYSYHEEQYGILDQGIFNIDNCLYSLDARAERIEQGLQDTAR
jgi:hypothetical protein